MGALVGAAGDQARRLAGSGLVAYWPAAAAYWPATCGVLAAQVAVVPCGVPVARLRFPAPTWDCGSPSVIVGAVARPTTRS